MMPTLSDRALPARLLAAFLLAWSCQAAAAQATVAQGAPADAAAAVARPRPAAAPDGAPRELTISVGEIAMAPIKGKVIRMAVGSGNLISTTTVDSSLLLIAEQPGVTSLLVWTRDAMHSFRVQVIPKSLADIRSKIEALTRGMPGISVQQVGAELVLSGVAHRDAVQKLAASLKDAPGVVFNVREDQGSAYTRSVLFRLHFIEVKRSLLEKIGIQWDKVANGPAFGAIGVARATGVYDNLREVQPGENLLGPVPPFVRNLGRGGSGGVFLGLATALGSRLNLGIADGDVRVLASPELTARSGGKAQLQVGGEVPIPTSGAFGSTNVQFKPYGILLSIAPQVDSSDVITASVSTELSQIDPAVSVGGIPGFVTRNTSTEVSIKPGEMVALAGLVNSEMSSAIDRMPALSRIPILGRLFRSDDFRNSKTELVVLLEPEIIAPGDGLAQQLRERGTANIAEFRKKEAELKQPALPDARAARDDERPQP